MQAAWGGTVSGILPKVNLGAAHASVASPEPPTGTGAGTAAAAAAAAAFTAEFP